MLRRNGLVANPFVGKLLTKYFYPVVTRQLGADDVVFFNFGYEENPPMALPLAASDEANRFCIQLYHRIATQVDLKGKQLLEVSCGHGGGASYVMRTLSPASYTGLDLNPAAVEFCRQRHNLAGLEFVQGNAEHLPFADESFDAVINVEASHHYPRFPRFLAEVARVLRPGGYLLYTDFRRRQGISAWEAALAHAPMRLVSERVINDEVVRGLTENSKRSQDLVSRRVPVFLLGLVRYGIRHLDSDFRRAVESGEFPYRMYCFAND